MKEDNGPKEMDSGANIPEEDEIIELTEEITASPEKDEILDLDDEVNAAQEADDVLDLTDEVAASPEAEEILELDDVAGPAAEEIVDLVDEASASPEEDDIQYGDALDEEIELSHGDDDDFVNSLGMDLDEDLDTPEAEQADDQEAETLAGEEKAIDTGALSSDRIEAAVERVLMRILPEKIDRLLVKTIEKTVTQEIDKIKTALLDE